jgi:hypothetical protein
MSVAALFSHPPNSLALLASQHGAASQSYSDWEAGGVARATVNLRLTPTHPTSYY